jgi:hypothetical protein
MKATQLHDKMYHYTDLLTDEEKEKVNSFLEGVDDWQKIFDDGHEYRQNEDDNASQSIMVMYRKEVVPPNYEDIRKIINSTYDRAHQHYISLFGIPNDNQFHPFGAVDKHMPGTAYATHIDSAPIGVESFTMLFYLNDSYTGGEIAFSLPRPDYKFHVINGIVVNGPRSNRSPEDPKNAPLIDFWLKPEAFSIIIFPPLYPYIHTVHTITSGFKYLIKGHWQVNKADITQWSANPYEGFTDEELANKEDMQMRHGLMYEALQESKDLVPADIKEYYI